MRALISVYDKTGLDMLASGLAELGWEIVSSGGTSSELSSLGIDHIAVESITGVPEMLGGRVKTLHPKIHGGILADRSDPAHVSDLDTQEIEAIDLVVCNLYPFGREPSIELIDIGGPAMVRAAAKNHEHVGVVVDPSEYVAVLDELRDRGSLALATRRRLARTAFALTAAYDQAIAAWLGQVAAEAVDAPGLGASVEGQVADEAVDGELPELVRVVLEKVEDLRYGENPHQRGARYRYREVLPRQAIPAPGWWDGCLQHSGIAMSYLNYFDAEAAWRLVADLSALDPEMATAVVVKHANPCGAAMGQGCADVYEMAFECDSLSAFGGVVALSRRVDMATAAKIGSNPKADVLIAPSYDPQALEMLKGKRKNMRILEAPPFELPAVEVRSLCGGALVQQADSYIADRSSWNVVTDAAPTELQLKDLEMAWRVCARTASNAIVIVRDLQAVGVGAGQQNRVDSSRIAARKAGERSVGSVAASDAFFPFRDGLEALASAGVTAVVQPGGSMRDQELIDAADELGIAMVMTGERHFRH